MPNTSTLTAHERLAHANALITAISEHGRKFFRHHDRVSQMQLDQEGRVWFLDMYRSKFIDTHQSGRWEGFSHGGTLRGLVEQIRDYVVDGTYLSSWIICPERIREEDGNIWGYSKEDAAALRAICATMPIFGEL